MAELKAYRYTVKWKYKGEENKTEHVGVCPTCLELVEPETWVQIPAGAIRG
jgi:hypothetical protein